VTYQLLITNIKKGTTMSQNSVVVVTGVSSGIGRITAEKFAKQGCRVFGTVRNLSKTKPFFGVELVEMDVRNEESVKRGILSIVDKAKRIDVLVNSAGVTLLGAMEESSIDEARALFDTNLFGLLNVIKAVLPQMRNQRSGRIVNVSSVLGFLRPLTWLSIRLPSMPSKGYRKAWIMRCVNLASA
jgi:NADP-dependent 3-hydroxy acid dehydrogenase YdfG